VRIASPRLALASVFLITWFHPYAFGTDTIRCLTYVMVVEFLAIHSFFFLGGAWAMQSKGWRFGCLGAALLLYAPIIAVLTITYGGWWPLCAFVALTCDRLHHISAAGQNEKKFGEMASNWVASFILFLITPYIAIAFPNMPLGVTSDIAAQVQNEIHCSWHPFRLLLWGTMYHSAMALWSVRGEIRTLAKPG